MCRFEAPALLKAAGCFHFIPSRVHLLDVTDVCVKHQNMALSFSANRLLVCNRFQLASRPWRKRALGKEGGYERHRDRAYHVGLLSSSGVEADHYGGSRTPRRDGP